MCLASGKRMDMVLELISHPRIVFTSSLHPSPTSFFRESRSSHGIGSFGCTGRPMICRASRTAAAHCSALSPMSWQMGSMSLMYTSMDPLLFIGRFTANSFAGLNGMAASR